MEKTEEENDIKDKLEFFYDAIVRKLHNGEIKSAITENVDLVKKKLSDAIENSNWEFVGMLSAELWDRQLQ